MQQQEPGLEMEVEFKLRHSGIGYGCPKKMQDFFLTLCNVCVCVCIENPLHTNHHGQAPGTQVKQDLHEF